MRIVKLVLKGYVRLFLSHINKIEYIPENKVNLIIGTNGGGKSSLMKELSPLPADLGREYEDGGYKEIFIEHNGSMYELSSGVVAKNKHSFIVDNEELNPAGTKKVQLLLVKEHFNLTPDIHNVMLGLKGFTRMSVMERKNWLTNISTVDYTYSLNVFNKLKQRNRDIVGALKIVQAELTKNDASIITSEEKKEAIKEIQTLKDLIALLMESKVTTNQIGINNDHIARDVIAESESILKHLVLPYNIKMKDVDKTAVELNLNIKNNTVRKNQIDETLKELMFIEDSKGSGTVDDAEKKIASIKQELQDIADSIYIDLNIEDVNRFKSMFDYAHSKLLEILQAIVLHSVDDYTISEYRRDMGLINNMNKSINNLDNLLIKLDTEKKSMEHKRDHNSVTCGDCGNMWSVGFSLKDYNAVNNKIKEVHEKKISTEEQLKKLVETTEFFDNKLKSVEDIRLMFSDKSMEILQPMFRYINTNANILNNANGAMDILHKISQDINSWLKYNVLITDLDNALKDREVIAEKREIELKHFNANKDKIEEELHYLIVRIKSDTHLESCLKTYQNNRTRLQKNQDILIKYLKQKKTDLNTEIVSLRNNSINESISMLNMEISKLEHKVSESVYSEKIIENSKAKVKQLNMQKEATSILIDGMSPTNGLIGKSITNFLNVFTRDMNDIINSIWNYEMEILPCQITEDNDLDYKFGVRIDNRMPVKDVSETSSSQQEIIDLAFKIVSMKYLKMDNSYLLLDEFGRTFDEAHSKNAYDIIDILSNSSFSNVFIISHFENTYTRFRNADINVLNNDNLILNKELEVNKVIKIS